jgi:putative ABC transport system permease protein
MMLFALAYRNIWRNKRRSIIVMTSVAVGVVATMLTDTLSMGMIVQMFENQVGAHVSHIQIHRKGFNENRIIQNYIPDNARVESVLRSDPRIRAFSPRVITFGLLSSASTSSGVSIIGIDHLREKQVTSIERSIIEGSYLDGGMNAIVLGRRLAEKLDIDLGDKVVAMASTLDGHVGSDLFRVVGIYETFSSEFDRTVIYIDIANAQKMLALGGKTSEFAIVTHDKNLALDLKERLARELSEEYEILSYADLLPFLVMQLDMYREYMFIVYAIIGIALFLGIINTMLMSIFERIHEFGVLMAIGLMNSRLFIMILLEAFFLGIIGTVAGFSAGYGIFLILADTGIDLGDFSEGLNSFGVGSVIYPLLTFDVIASALLIIPFVSVLGAIYPAVRAIRLQPMSAIRFV